MTPSNLDHETVTGFGDEWTAFDQSGVGEDELDEIFEQYFSIFEWDRLPSEAVGFDMGCGSGRWARRVARRVGRLHCIDASERALEVAAGNLADHENCVLHLTSVEGTGLPHSSMDFGYSLGVLHHVPDTQAAMTACVQLLKPGAPLLLYLYYAFDNRPLWYRLLWRLSDVGRRGLSRAPHDVKLAVSAVSAVIVYWPLARTARVAARLGLSGARNLPLSYYAKRSLYTMRTDAYDRFGTRLEQRFTRAEIAAMMERAGLGEIRFSEREPFWCAVGTRADG
jgi:SAM-dependent methyltransferase